ncbi:MAG: hypothetical protein ABI348_01475 [Nitrososphaera sp.]
MNVSRTEKMMAVALAAIVLSFATLAPGSNHNTANAASGMAEEQKVQDAHALLTEKMKDKDKGIPLFLSYVDQDGTLVAGIDDAATGKTEMYKEKIKSLVGDVPLKVVTGHLDRTACASRSTDCTPIIGAIQIQHNGNQDTLTIGATNNAGKKGFIMSGHGLGAWGVTGTSVGQATTSRIVGTVITNPSGPSRPSDSAFVEFSKNIFGQYNYSADETAIFKNSSNNYNILGKKTSSLTPLGETVYLHGVTSGIRTGHIIGKGITISDSIGTNTGQVITDTVPVAGDSGGPVTSFALTDVYFYGLIVGSITICDPSCTSSGVYSPWEGIKSDLSLP